MTTNVLLFNQLNLANKRKSALEPSDLFMEQRNESKIRITEAVSIVCLRSNEKCSGSDDNSEIKFRLGSSEEYSQDIITMASLLEL